MVNDGKRKMPDERSERFNLFNLYHQRSIGFKRSQESEDSSQNNLLMTNDERSERLVELI